MSVWAQCGVIKFDTQRDQLVTTSGKIAALCTSSFFHVGGALELSITFHLYVGRVGNQTCIVT